MMEELVDPISADEPVPVRDLAKSDQTGQVRQVKEIKKHNFRYYAVLAAMMLALTVLGIIFGVFLKRPKESTPAIVTPTPIVVPTKEATPASTIEVIRQKIGSLEQKMADDSFQADELYPPNIDYNLNEVLEDLE